MPEGAGAGASAAERARRMREQAARLTEQADHWEAGAAGERLTGEILAPLDSTGFVVLHDLAIPGSKANVDHVIVTSWGVAVLDSKNYSGQVKLSNGMLWRAKYPMRRELDTLAWETDQVRAAITRALPQWQLTYRSILCIHGPHLLPPGLRVDRVEVVAPRDLVGALTTGPPLLSPAHITAVGSVLRANLEPRSNQQTVPSSASPSSPWAPPRPQPPHRPPPRRDLAPPGRPIRPTVPPRSGPPPSSAGKPAVLILGLLVLFATAGGVVIATGSRLASRVAIPVPRTSLTTVAPSPELTFECPASAKGWSLTLRWKATEAPTVTWEALTAPSPSGPWTSGTPGADSHLRRLSPGSVPAPTCSCGPAVSSV